MPYDPDLSSSLRSSTMLTQAGSSDTTGGTSYVHTPGNVGKGPAEHDVEKDEDEEEDYDEIGMSQLGDAPFPTQFDAQVLETTLHHIRHNYLNIVSNDAYIVIVGSLLHSALPSGVPPVRPYRRWVHP